MKDQDKTTKQLTEELATLRGHVAELEQTESVLREKLAEHEMILDAVPAMIFYKDRENRLTRVNKELADASGLTKAEMEGKTLFELYPDLAEDYWRDDMEVMESGQPKRNIIEPLQTPDGIKWLKTDKIPYRDEGGHIAGIIGFAIDITEHQRAEDALRVSEARYQDLYDNAPDMCASVDPKTAMIVGCNQTLATALGYTKDEIVGRAIFDMYDLDCMEQVEAAFQSFVQTGEVLDEDLQLRRKDGSKIDVNLKVSAVRDEDGSILFSRSSWRDITERKRTQQKLEQTMNGLARSLAELERFHRLAVGREHRMMELKRRINDLLSEVGKPPAYLNFAESDVHTKSGVAARR